MSEYIVSARKYRPNSFESLVGQDNIAKTLKNSIQRGQLSHAYLFCGPRGVGKTSTARIFAKAINCSNPGDNMEPCGECESCRSFAEGRSFCIHELDAASNNGVEDIKALMDQVQVPPQTGKYSVFIIDEVHMLSTSAFNAFLKTLEEPPSHAIFILATTEKHKVLPTILSRCQTYDFNRISIPDIVRNLRQIATGEAIGVDDESLHVIASKADGAMRDALTIFDQMVAFCGSTIRYEDVLRNLNVLDSEYGFRLTDCFLSGDYAAALLVLDEVLKKGFNPLYFLSCLGEHFRDLLVSRTGGLESLLEKPASLRERFVQQASRCSIKFIYDALGIVNSCEAQYKGSINQRLLIEYGLMRLAFLASAPSVESAQAPEKESEAAKAETPAASEAEAPAEQIAPAAVQESAPAAAEQSAPSRRVRRSAVSLDSMISSEESRAELPQQSSHPMNLSQKALDAVWEKVAGYDSITPRLAAAIRSNKAVLGQQTEDGRQVISFEVMNQAQKNWIEANKLREIEGILAKEFGRDDLALQITVHPEEERVQTAYLPREQAMEMIEKNSAAREFIKEFELDIK